jgi:hypothetical protein
MELDVEGGTVSNVEGEMWRNGWVRFGERDGIGRGGRDGDLIAAAAVAPLPPKGHKLCKRQVVNPRFRCKRTTAVIDDRECAVCAEGSVQSIRPEIMPVKHGNNASSVFSKKYQHRKMPVQ